MYCGIVLYSIVLCFVFLYYYDAAERSHGVNMTVSNISSGDGSLDWSSEPGGRLNTKRSRNKCSAINLPDERCCLSIAILDSGNLHGAIRRSFVTLNKRVNCEMRADKSGRINYIFGQELSSALSSRACYFENFYNHNSTQSHSANCFTVLLRNSGDLRSIALKSHCTSSHLDTTYHYRPSQDSAMASPDLTLNPTWTFFLTRTFFE